MTDLDDRSFSKRTKLHKSCQFRQIDTSSGYLKALEQFYSKSHDDQNDVHGDIHSVSGCSSQETHCNASTSNNEGKFSTESDSIHVIHEPYRICSIRDVFTYDEGFIDELTQELTSLTFHQKDNDLYKFQQSGDLHNETSPCISDLRKTLETDVCDWLSSLTGLALSPNIDIFCSRYSYTDYLLCHDDRLDNRCIAFNYYLNSDWSNDDGGSLDLYSSDKKGEPGEIITSITPGHNMLVFFEVSPVTYHQVSEVLCQHKTRLTISGWYRGTTIRNWDVTPHTDPPLTLTCAVDIDESVFYKWINPLYLATSVQADIRHKFEDESEIELIDFIQPELYTSLLEEITGVKNWKKLGPPNKRYTEVCDTPGPLLSEYLNVIQSDAMFLTLSHLTGLQLHPLYTDSDEDGSGEPSCSSKQPKESANAQCTTNVHHWSHGHYTLVHDKDNDEASRACLDATIFLGVQDLSPECGGYTSYIAKGDDIEILSVNPSNNCLALVYKDVDSLKFVKRINHKLNKGFYSISSVYYE